MPVVAQVSESYSDDEIVFLGVAGRSDIDSTAAAAESLFGDSLLWGLDDSLWDLYGIPYQPATVLITGGDTIVDAWPGVLDESEMRARIDNLIAVSS